MQSVLISWIGKVDIESASSSAASGPIEDILKSYRFDQAYLLHNQPKVQISPFFKYIEQVSSAKVESIQANLSSPIHFGDIYKELDRMIARVASAQPEAEIILSLTSGTPAMTAVSILLGKGKYACKFIQSSREQGVQFVDLPFDIAADFLPALADQNHKAIVGAVSASAPVTAAFDDILTQNAQMLSLKERAAVLAQCDWPVLIYGETGTGKELFAKAIHNGSQRSSKLILTLNCGAIPRELIDATLFGHTKGAFTGAAEARKGYFEQADGGTLFLDEFGELPKESQVRLLRVLQDGSYTPVGSTKEHKADVRIIAATNRNLVDEIAQGRFREDLFYRVAIGVLHLPPLRDRPDDIPLLAAAILEQIANDISLGQSVKHKKISVVARKFMQSHPWPGNVRELYATLVRASLWQPKEQLTDKDIREALIVSEQSSEQVLDKDISQGIDLNAVIGNVYRHYIERALTQTNQNKSKAAELLGLKNYQTLNNWIEKFGVK